MKYTSGRFATGYRATIGTDFVTKTVPHYSQVVAKQAGASKSPSPPNIDDQPLDSTTPPADPITLQIWDTAGQERFSSLSTAFFRGADAVILVYDVNRPDTLTDLERWWNEFRVKVPIAEGEEADYCVVIVGNKTDLVPMTLKAGKPVIGQSRAMPFLRDLIPVPGAEDIPLESPSQELPMPSANLQSYPASPAATTPQPSALSAGRPPPQPLQAPGADASTARPSHLSSVLKSPTKFGTMTSSRTGVSIYHTPSSSLFESPTTSRLAGSRRSPSQSHSPPPPPALRAPRSEEDLEHSMDIEYDYRYEVNASASSMSGYATAKSTPSQSPSEKSSVGDPLPRRATLNSVTSESSLSTVRPTAPTAIAFRESPLRTDSPTSLSPSRSRASTLSSASTNAPDHDLHPLDLPTPSASPPSPPVLTASLMATLHEQRQLDLSTAVRKELDVGPKLFFTSAKTMVIRPDHMPLTPVAEVFSYIAERVTRRWEWEESRLELQESSEEGDYTGRASQSRSLTVRLSERWKDMTSGSSCCGS